MKLTDLEFIRLLPQFMREDGSVQGLSLAMDVIIPGLARSLRKLTTWDQIDTLSEDELDELAWELNILWYDIGATLDVKRELIRNSDKVYQRLGTKWAVETIINTYFGEGYIQEWFEYGGEPGHFRVYSTNPTLNQARLVEFLNIVNKVKRATAKLDGVFISLTGQMALSAGVAFHDVGVETYAIGARM